MCTFIRPWLTRTHCCRHIVADTNASPFARARNICCGHKFFCPGHRKSFWFCSETFCVRNKCFPVRAAQETSWVTICPRQCAVVLKTRYRWDEGSNKWYFHSATVYCVTWLNMPLLKLWISEWFYPLYCDISRVFRPVAIGISNSWPTDQ